MPQPTPRSAPRPSIDPTADIRPFDPAALSVLVFEDNARDATLIRKFLETAGVQAAHIHHADTIPSAMQVLSRGPVDICLADYYLSPHTGLDLMDEVRRCDFDVPFVVMTALDDRTVDHHALAHGAYGFLVKGELTVERLERSLRYALAQYRREAQMGRDAGRDVLTGLMSRHAFIRTLTETVADRGSKAGMVGVAVFNLDGLRQINETKGYAAGDDVLRAIARRLRRAKRGGEFVARLDGAEFALMMTDILLAPQALARGRAVAALLAKALDADGLIACDGVVASDGPALSHTVSAGIAAQTITAGTAPAAAAERLLLHAGYAMRDARRSADERPETALNVSVAFAHIH